MFGLEVELESRSEFQSAADLKALRATVVERYPSVGSDKDLVVGNRDAVADLGIESAAGGAGCGGHQGGRTAFPQALHAAGGAAVAGREA